MKKMRYIAILLLTVFLSAVEAEAAPVAPDTVSYVVEICPAPEKLSKKDALWWIGPGEWKSYNESFAHEIAYFSGAQWVGINVGKIICIYKGKGKATFPITVEREILVSSPTGGKWGKDEGGYKNCLSSIRSDCQFKLEKPKAVGNVYEELKSFKK